MPVDPDFHRPGAVRADLDERRAEPGVPQVEVVHRDPAVLLVEGELRAPGRVGVTLAGDEHPLGFLGHPDRRDLRPARSGRGPVQVGAHHLDVAVGGLQRHHRDVVGLGEGGDPAAEGIPDLLQARRGRDRVAAVVQELDHLPADLQLAQVAVKVETVQALQVERHVPVEHVVHRDRHRPLDPGRHGNLRDVAYERRMRPPARKRPRNRKPRRYQAEPAWETDHRASAIIVLAVVGIVALTVLSFAVHVLFSHGRWWPSPSWPGSSSGRAAPTGSLSARSSVARPPPL